MQPKPPLSGRGDELVYSRSGPIARITLNRPEKRNAQNLAMLGRLAPALERAAADPEVRVVVLSVELRDGR
jgi:enoyl-CoA hydratase